MKPHGLFLAALILSPGFVLRSEEVAVAARSRLGGEPTWSKARLYSNPESTFIQEFALTGRAHFEYFAADSD
jgi:hypothetical protein